MALKQKFYSVQSGFISKYFAARVLSLSAVLVLIAAILLVTGLLATAPPVAAQQDEETPYWASIDQETARTRTGPNRSYQIMWVYQRKYLPVKVVKRYKSWRKIEDPDGTQGWMFFRLLSRTRTGIVTGEVRPMHAKPSTTSRVVWRVEPGVVGKLEECANGWCLFDVRGRAGWIRETHLWGTGKP